MERINKHKHHHLPNLTNTKTRSPLQVLNRPLLHHTTTINHPNTKSISKPKPISPSQSKNAELIAPKSKPISRSQSEKNNELKQYAANPRLQKKKGSRMSNLGNKPLIPPSAKVLSRNANLISYERCSTPVGKLADNVVVDDDGGDGNVDFLSVGEDVEKALTPPVEASVSPEIQFSLHSKILASKSGATPVCYGAGHHLSGVTDRRKCRRRGSLKGGFEKPNMSLDCDASNGDLGDEFSIPLIPVASVRWHLSSDDQNSEDHHESSSDLVSKLLLSSDFVCDLDNYSGIDNAASKMDETVNVLDSREDLEFNRILEFPDKILDEQFSTSPSNSFELSTGSLSSGNMIQTPNSDLSSDRFLRRLNVDIGKGDIVESDLNSLTSMWGAPDFGDVALPLDSDELDKVQKNEDCLSSWVSDATLGNSGLSEMRISWRDSLEIERDEFDCCRCLSDEEEIDAKCGAIVEKDLDIDDDDLSPEILDYEPIISEKQKGKVPPHLTNTCAESICTNGSSLFASGDSDWTGCSSNNNYFKFSTHNQRSGARM